MKMVLHCKITVLKRVLGEGIGCDRLEGEE